MCIELFHAAIVGEGMISKLHAFGDILLGRIHILHLPLLIIDKLVIGDLVCFRASHCYSLISHFRVGVDSEQMEMFLTFERLDLSDRPDAFDDGILSALFGLLVQLLDDVCRPVFGAQIVGDRYHAVPIDRHPSPLDLLDQICPYRKMMESSLLDEIVNDGAFACTDRSGDAYDDHLMCAMR